ncbi:MAG: serine/threonine phosphatase [Microcoleaceae cyanobacterium]
MLICPQCEFENPNHNKFCQQCGTSLTHKYCHECGMQVAWSDPQCHNCGAYTGQVWQAIIVDQAEALSSSAPDLNQKTVEPEAEILSGASSKAKYSASSATDVITDKFEEVIKSSEDSPLTDISQQKIEIEAEATNIPAASFQNTDPDTENYPPTATTSDETLSEAEVIAKIDTRPEDAEELEIVESITADTLSPISEAENKNEPSSSKNEENLSTESGKYLDSQQRYQLLDSIPPINLGETVVYVKVLDCHPLQETPLKVWLLNNSGKFKPQDAQESKLSLVKNQQSKSPLTCPEEEAKEMEALIIPIIAQPYLALHYQLPQHLPAIQDGWGKQTEEILLLEDYSSWPRLADVWGSQQISKHQILSWLQQMTELWAALAPWHCCKSLLERENLRVSETDNYYIKLQYLYSRPGEPENLQDLMQFWQWLFEQSQRTQFGWVTALLQDLRDGEIKNIEELRARLMNTQDNLQPQPSPTSVPTILQTDESPPEVVDISTQETELLPTQLVSLESAGATDVGRQRDHNEDSFGIQTQIESQETPTERIIQAKGLYVLCDGMGGHASGEIASEVAVDTIKQYFKAKSDGLVGLPTEETIREGILEANQVIYEINQQEIRSGSSRMGTTLVMALVHDGKVAVAHVGDSRLYIFSRKVGLEQITLDHEVGQREINRGVEPELAYARPDAYQLTQALGPRDVDFVRPDVQFLEIDEDSLLILASDGLTDNELLESYWETHLEPLLDKQANLEQGVSQLIDLANQYNGHDNITAIVIRALVKPK